MRASLARLARDETRHAALAWTMAAWLEARLTPEARERGLPREHRPGPARPP